MTYVLSLLFAPIDRALLAIARRWSLAARGEKVVALGKRGTVTIAVACDFTGDTCLRTNLLTKKALDVCSPGEVVEIASDNLASVETIPFMLPGHGCSHIATLRTESGWKIYARKEDYPKCNA